MNSFDNFGSNFRLTPMKRSILLLLSVLLISCQKQAVKKDNVNDLAHAPKNSVDYVGTYKGILPCADCHGLETELVINENATFSIRTKYQGKGDKVYMQKGNFSWNKKGNIIILTDIKSAPNQYLVGKNTLTQLDMSGQKITGSEADEYVLSKQPADTSQIEPAEEKNEAMVDLNSRIATTTKIEKVNPAVGKYTLAETKWKLVSLNNQKVAQNGKQTYFLKMSSKDGRFTAYAGCNNIGGNYAMPSSSTLDFSDVIMTRMACPEMTLENQFGAMLVQVTHYKLDKKALFFFDEKKKNLAKFEAFK